MTSFEIEITEIKVPSVNHYISNVAMGKRVVRFLTKQAKDFKKYVQTKVLEHINYKVPELYLKRLEVEITLFFNTRRKKDVGNYEKCIIDVLQGLVFKDDSQIIKQTIEKHYTPEKEGFSIKIKPYEGNSNWGNW